jgi:hypothetical protein
MPAFHGVVPPTHVAPGLLLQVAEAAAQHAGDGCAGVGGLPPLQMVPRRRMTIHMTAGLGVGPGCSVGATSSGPRFSLLGYVLHYMRPGRGVWPETSTTGAMAAGSGPARAHDNDVVVGGGSTFAHSGPFP